MPQINAPNADTASVESVVERPLWTARTPVRPASFKLAALLSGLIVALALLVAFIFPNLLPIQNHYRENLNPLLLASLPSGSFDTTWQRIAHLLMLFAFTGGVLFSSELMKLWRQVKAAQTVSKVMTGLLMAAFSVFVAISLARVRDHIDASMLTMMAAPLLLLLPRSRLINSRWSTAAAIGGIVIVLAAAIVPGLICRADLSWLPPASIITAENHFNLVVAQCDRVGIGQKLIEQVGPDYGCVFPLIFGAWQLHFGAMQFGDFIQVIRWLELGYLAMAAFLYWQYSRGRPCLALYALATVVPWYYFNQDCTYYYPNHSPWRLIGMPAGLLAIYLLRRLHPQRLFYLIGAVACMTLLINLETGIAVSIGLLAYAHFRYRCVVSRLATGECLRFWWHFLGGTLTICALFLATQYLLLGYLPAAASLANIFKASGTVLSTGYSGTAIYFSPIVVLMLFHSGLVLFRTAMATNRPLNFWISFRAGVAAFILVWFAYWFNRPYITCLGSFYFLYGFLLIDLMAAIRSSPGKKASAVLLAALAALAIIVIPDTVKDYRLAWPYYSYGLFDAARQILSAGTATGKTQDSPEEVADAQSPVLISGAYFSKDVARELTCRARFIKQASANGPAVYLTANTYLIQKLSGVYSPLNLEFRDTFTGVIMRHDLERLLQKLSNAGYPRIYFDDPHSLLVGPHGYQNYYDWLRKQVASRYLRIQCTDGWEIWQRK